MKRMYLDILKVMRWHLKVILMVMRSRGQPSERCTCGT
jgi:hypothetical protein